MDNEDFNKYIENHIRKLDLETEKLEIIGSSLNALGYLIISYGADIDIYDIITNNEVDVTSTEVTLFGQLIIVIGYLTLLVVSRRRVYTRKLRNEYLNENNFISSYEKLETSYLLSTLSNFLRLEAFYEIFLNREMHTDDNTE